MLASLYQSKCSYLAEHHKKEFLHKVFFYKSSKKKETESYQRNDENIITFCDKRPCHKL